MAYEHLDAIEKLDIGHNPKVVLIWLARRANADGEAWPSYADIGCALCLSASSVSRAMRVLTDLGIIVRVGTMGRGIGRFRLVTQTYVQQTSITGRYVIRRPTDVTENGLTRQADFLTYQADIRKASKEREEGEEDARPPTPPLPPASNTDQNGPINTRPQEADGMILRQLGCVIDDPDPTRQAALRAEWTRETKGLTQDQIHRVIDAYDQGVGFPSEFRAARRDYEDKHGLLNKPAQPSPFEAGEDGAAKARRQAREAEVLAYNRSAAGQARTAIIFARVTRDRVGEEKSAESAPAPRQSAVPSLAELLGEDEPETDSRLAPELVALISAETTPEQLSSWQELCRLHGTPMVVGATAKARPADRRPDLIAIHCQRLAKLRTGLQS
jgi:hypothetical protein